MSAKATTLWRLMRGNRLRYALAMAAILLSALFMNVRPFISKGVIDYVIGGEDLEAPRFVRDAVEAIGARSVLAQNLWIAAVGIVSLTALSGLFTYLKGRWAARAAESTARSLRQRLYDHIQHMPCRSHDDVETGDMVQRCTSDVETIRMFLSLQVVEIGRAVILIGVALPMMIYLDVRMTLVAMTVLPVVVVFAVVFFAAVKSTFKRSDEAEGRMTSMLQENLAGIRVVRAFARQDFERERFARSNLEYRDRWHGLIKTFAWYWPISDMLCVGQVAAVLIFGAHRVAQGEITVGTLYAFIAFVNFFLWPVRHMGRVLADLGKAVVAIGRVGEILAAPVESDPAEAVEAQPPDVRGEIVVENLSFAHTADVPVLRDVSLTIAAGQTLGILGPSGSGKSTLINLLLRLYDYEAPGSIRLDGVEIRDLPRKFVRAQIGAVLQEPFLYSKTIRENIKLGLSAAPDDEMIHASSSACIHESIEGFEKGYDTLVGEKGVTLSGGQRQRVALARALLKKPPILILDDAFSAVDTRTESVIQRALRHRHGRQTTLVIAHRLTTLMGADKIVVFDGGRIVQAGTHEELLAAEGMYRRLWRIQNALEDEFGSDPRVENEADGRP